MRKIILIGLLFSCAGAFAQQSSDAKMKALSHMNPALLKMHLPVVKNGGIDNGGPVNRRNAVPNGHNGDGTRTATTETKIGDTYYDLQTNNSISNRIVRNADGTISAVWTYSPDGASGYPLRGTGYNYFDGTTWQAAPTSRIENERAGFTTIGVTTSGEEVVIAHGIQTSGTNKGMILTTRPTKGTGAWTSNDAVMGSEPADTIDLWPKTAIGGSDGKTIHAIWRGGATNNQYSGQIGPVYYSRSTDGGTTWDKLETIITPIDSDYYRGFSADEYSIDARGTTVAIVLSATGTDVVMLKSTDNGSTWTKHIVSRFGIDMFDATTMATDTAPYDGVVDTLWTGTGDANLVIDNNNEVHVFFSMVRSAGDVGSYSYYPYSAELFYWNDTYADNTPMFIAYAPDLNGNGTIDIPGTNSSCTDNFPFGTYGTTRILEDPSAGVDANNTLYVVYQTVDENGDATTVANNNSKAFKHPYIIKSSDGGATWSDYNAPYDVMVATIGADAEFNEGVYASMAKRVDNLIHIVYQRDPFPGNSLATAGTCEADMNSVNSPSDIIYVGVDPNAVNVKELPATKSGVVLSANYPNPASAYTKFTVSLNTSTSVKLNVTDILGQNIYSENKGILPIGVHTVTLNTSVLASGVYFYTVTTGTEKVTGKFIVKQ